MKKLSIAGVPEHFNLPWHLLLERGRLRELDPVWRDFADGTGAMVAALDAAEIDLAVLLTEGAVLAAATGHDLQIISRFVDSPLIWGIHVPASSAARTEADLRGARYAISRKGSGSHLISYAFVQSRGWPLDELEFVEVGTLDGAIAALDAGDAEVFLWERFMTQPVVDAGAFRRVGEFAARWPAFVVCARGAIAAEFQRELRGLIDDVCAIARELAGDPDAAELIAGRYGLETDGVVEWLRLTRWSRSSGIDPAALDEVGKALRGLGLIDARP